MKLQAWTPFQEMQRPDDWNDAPQMVSSDPDFRVWRNSRYQVITSKIWPHDEEGNVIKTGHYILQLSIKRVDKLVIHDWRDLQRIKNELAGPEMLAVEIYPPESKLVDTANQYFLWVVPPHWIDSVFAFIFQTRSVSELSWQGSKNRPWPADAKPTDLETPESLAACQRELIAKGGAKVMLIPKAQS